MNFISFIWIFNPLLFPDCQKLTKLRYLYIFFFGWLCLAKAPGFPRVSGVRLRFVRWWFLPVESLTLTHRWKCFARLLRIRNWSDHEYFRFKKAVWNSLYAIKKNRCAELISAEGKTYSETKNDTLASNQSPGSRSRCKKSNRSRGQSETRS
jgi:hypothetical protein